MEGEIQIVIDNIDNAMDIFNAMLAAQKSVIFYGIIIFLIGAVIGLLIHRKNHNEALKNILDIIKYASVLIIVSCITFTPDFTNGKTVNLIITSYAIINIIIALINEVAIRKNNKK